ncbi:MAG: glycosyltransferase, partial [Firmicutes bacterium]|nr:glycosyltransferase [Bacillota bacterium]
MRPKISVIVPVYNVEDYLVGMLKDVENQTFCDFEVLMVDDGSTDLSGEIIDKFA